MTTGGRPLAVIVSPVPNTRGGGVEHHCGLVGDLLRDEGWRVEEVGPNWTQTTAARRLGLSALMMSRSSVAAIGERRPDLVVSNGLLGAGAPAAIPRIHVYHGTIVAHVLRGEAHDMLARDVVRRVGGDGLTEALGGRGAVTVAVAERAAQEVRRYYGRRVDAVIPTAVDTDRFRPRDRAEARARLGLDAGERIALFVGRLETRKGAGLLAAITDAAGWTLAVAGDQAPERGHHLGQLDHQTLPWAYAAADAVLFPTRYEGNSFVVLEALSSGTPLVSSDVGLAPTVRAAVPGYHTIGLAQDVRVMAAGLHAVAAGSLGDAPARAREYIIGDYTLEHFRQRWSALIRDTVPQAAAVAAQASSAV